MIRRAILFALLLPLLAACGSKNPKPAAAPPPPPPKPGAMRDLFPPQPTKPKPAAATAPAAASAQTSAAQAPAAAPAAAAAAGAAGTAASQWPLKLSSEGVAFEVHEPVADSWTDGILAARVLVVAQP